MAYDNNKPFEEKRNTESIFSKRIKAGKRRTYFFDVKETRSSDFFITITESKKRFNDDGYDRHKMFIYKEDFNKFLTALTETVDFVKTDLMPDFDFDAFNHDDQEDYQYQDQSAATPKTEVAEAEPAPVETSTFVSDAISESTPNEDIDSWKI